jgi:hypothetical protein
VLPLVPRESLDPIATKLAGILCGNANHVDDWHAIAGYARRAQGASEDTR